jgi:hypothetical protein
MPKPAILSRPDIEAKRKVNGQLIHVVSAKAIAWGKLNGYESTIDSLERFMAAYKAAHTQPDYYASQTPERLLEMVAEARKKMDKAMAALSTQNNGNGLH